MLKTIGNQFKKPTGFLGKIISAAMKKGNSFAYDTLLDILEIKDQDSLFEIGYGHGIGIEKILSKNNCSISGIDFSELMHKEATKRNKRHIELNNAKLYFGDFLTFNFGELRFDKIFCINVIYFWDNLEKPFLAIRNGLKDNGSFYFYMAHSDELNKLKFTKDDIFNKYSIENVVEKLNIAGFSKVDYQYKKGYFVKCEK
jgi:SAM-dependent methyltransferase